MLLQVFQRDGRFPERREGVTVSLITHFASQTGVPPGQCPNLEEV
jgi:hypothetical protein